MLGTILTIIRSIWRDTVKHFYLCEGKTKSFLGCTEFYPHRKFYLKIIEVMFLIVWYKEHVTSRMIRKNFWKLVRNFFQFVKEWLKYLSAFLSKLEYFEIKLAKSKDAIWRKGRDWWKKSQTKKFNKDSLILTEIKHWNCDWFAITFHRRKNQTWKNHIGF